MQPSQTRLLLTGFEPFGPFVVNPSWESVRMITEAVVPGVAGGRLQVDYSAARQGLYELLLRHRPAACLCTGLAPSAEFRLELQARKPGRFASLPGASMLRGHWPWETIETALNRLRVAHRRSEDAGAYVCESTYWALLEFREQHGFPNHAGFLHVPCLSEEYPLQRTTECLRAVVADHLAGL